MVASTIHWIDLEGEELANAIDEANSLSDSAFDGAMIEMASQHMNTLLQRIIGGAHGSRLLADCIFFEPNAASQAFTQGMSSPRAPSREIGTDCAGE
jgi:hypothetical protein